MQIGWINPNALAVETGLEALNANDGKQKPEKANKK
jgi:hypothetical protein